MSKITCKLLAQSNHWHLQPTYTGFLLLYKRGLIHMTQEIVKEKLYDTSQTPHLRTARAVKLRVIVNDTFKICYNTHDSWEIDEEYLDWSDFYFKSSFSRSRLEYLGERAGKIFPLGIFYTVYPPVFDKFALARSLILPAFAWKYTLVNLASAVNLPNFYRIIPKLNIMEALPDYDSSPRILFMTRTYDPYDDSERRSDKVAEKVRLNETRAGCIKLLRETFGSRFYGGFRHSDFAIKHFPDLLLPGNSQSRKWNYITRLKSFPICVATSGLHGANGSKFGEYVATSKAILSERPNYSVPGDFKDGSNYLGFNSPEECVEQAIRLVSNRELRNTIMLNNARYYQSYLRPDSLIMNSLLVALSNNWGLKNSPVGI